MWRGSPGRSNGSARPGRRLDGSETWTSAEQLRLFWFIQTYRDLPRLRKALAALRRLYPEARVLVVSDGDHDPQIAHVCTEQSVEFAFRSRLFGVEHGGEPVHKMLEAFLATD